MTTTQSAKKAVIAVGYKREDVSVTKGMMGWIYVRIWGEADPNGMKPCAERVRLRAEHDRLREVIRKAVGRPAPSGDPRNDTYVSDNISVEFQGVK